MKPWEIRKMRHAGKTLDTEFDFVRIANTHALVDNTVLTELIKEEK